MRVDAQALAPLLRQLQSSGLTIIATEEVPQSLARLAPGHQVKAEVLAQQGGGRTLVRIAGEAVSLNIPTPPSPGTLLDLTFISSQPRLTFALTTGDRQGVKLDLSEVGRWLTQAEAPPGEGTESAPLPRIGRLLEGHQADPARLAQRLREVVTRSGLFYESHLAEWATGQRPLSDILAEPQGSLSPLLKGARDPDSTQPVPAAPGDPRTLSLVKEQLSLLANGAFIWRGEAREGEQLDWRISRTDEEAGTNGERGWSTDLELELPTIGPVLAELRLTGHELKVALYAADGEGATLLKAHAGTLQEALAACGIRLARLEVSHEGAQ